MGKVLLARQVSRYQTLVFNRLLGTLAKVTGGKCLGGF